MKGNGAAVAANSATVPLGLTVSTLECDPFRIVRLRSDACGFGMLPELPSGDAYLVAVKLRSLDNYNLFLSERHISRTPVAAGGMCLVHRNSEARLDLQSPFDILQFHFPNSMLADSLDGCDARRGYTLHAPPFGTPDAVVDQLARALLPALVQPQLASRLYVSHVAMALSAHLLHSYGSAPPGTRRRGGLARWQEQRAKDLLMANLDGAISMADLAHVCGLTPSHFSAAFRQSTGVSPTAWLAEQRINKACALLLETDLPLAEVAIASGYADQAHFTRRFSRRMGMPPGSWRRQA
jgi:AraC-like DNA-binding protein